MQRIHKALTKQTRTWTQVENLDLLATLFRQALRALTLTCPQFGRDQFCTQVDASFSPFGHPTQLDASGVTSIRCYSSLLANEIRSLEMSHLRLPCTYDSVWPPNASLRNRRFPSYLVPLFENESSFKTVHMKMKRYPVLFNKVTSVFHASVLLLIINFVITLSK